MYFEQPVKVVMRPEAYLSPGGIITISLTSDGTYFYWLWCTGSLSEKPTKGQNVFLDVFSFKNFTNFNKR